MKFNKIMAITNSVGAKFLLYFSYKILLEIIYVFGICQQFDGFSYSINITDYLFYTMIYFVMTYVMMKLEKNKNNSALLMMLLNWFYFIPGFIYVELCTKDISFLLLLLLFFFELNIIYMLVSRKNIKKEIKINKNTECNVYVYYLFIVISMIGLFICAKYNKLRFDLSLDDVYEFRAEAKNIYKPTIFNYLKSWCALLIPIGIVYFHNKKESYIISLLIITQLFLFSFGKLKSDLILLLFAFVIIFFKTKYLRKIFLLVILITALSAILAIVNFKKNIFLNYFYRRGMFLVSKISYEYYDFFIVNHNPVDLLRQSWIRYFGITSPYSIPIGNVIGKFYYGSSGTNVCNGLVGDAIANFGVYGILIYPILYVTVLKIFDYVTREIDYKIILLVSLKFFIAFSNGFLFQCLLTQGFIICLILFYFIKRCGRGKLLYNVQCSKEKINY